MNNCGCTDEKPGCEIGKNIFEQYNESWKTRDQEPTELVFGAPELAAALIVAISSSAD